MSGERKLVCIHCGADVWWGLPRQTDPCYECGKAVNVVDIDDVYVAWGEDASNGGYYWCAEWDSERGPRSEERRFNNVADTVSYAKNLAYARDLLVWQCDEFGPLTENRLTDLAAA